MRRALAWFYGRPHLLLTLTMLMWGGNAVASRLSVGEVSPVGQVREHRGDAGLVLGAADTRRHIIADDRHERAVGRRLQPPRYRHGSSKLRIFREELSR